MSKNVVTPSLADRARGMQTQTVLLCLDCEGVISRFGWRGGPMSDDQNRDKLRELRTQDMDERLEGDA